MSRLRNATPSYRILLNNEETCKSELRSCLLKGASFDEHNINASELRDTIRNIKTALQPYIDASKALNDYYSKNASLTQGNEIRRERLNLAHVEAPETIKVLNQFLNSIDEDAESSLKVPSTIGSRVSEQTKSETEGVPTISDVNSVHNERVFVSHSVNIPPIVDPHGDRSFLPNRTPHFESHDREIQINPELFPANDTIAEDNNLSNEQYASDHNRLDPLSRHLLKLDLRKGLPDKFDGDPSKFWAWYMEINGYIVESEASPTQIIYILKANTVKKPRDLIDTYLSGGLSNPARIVAKIWESFKTRFGSNSKVTTHLLSQLRNFPKVKYPHQTDELEKLISICRAMQLNTNSCPDLKYIELQQGMREIWEKTPDVFINRWRKESTSIERKEHRTPSLQQLLDSLSIFIDENSNPNFQNNSVKVKTFATQMSETISEKPSCVIHNNSTHALPDCRAFRNLKYENRKKLLFENRLCYKCCGPHLSNRCNSDVTCSVCNKNHHDLLHPISNSESRTTVVNNSNLSRNPNGRSSGNSNGNSEQNRANEASSDDEQSRQNQNVKSFCTATCDSPGSAKTCSKTVPIEVRFEGSPNSITGLCILDEQSNRTFIDEYALRQLNPPSDLVKKNNYTLTTLSPNNLSSSIEGVIADGLEVRGIQKSSWMKLPPTLSHPALPDTRNETSSPRIVKAHKHISKFANCFPEIDPKLEVVMLIGTNCGEAMKTRCYGNTYPYVHDTPLGWALVGPCSLDESSSPRALRTSVQQECEHFQASPKLDISNATLQPESSHTFAKMPDDELPGFSSNNREFNKVVSKQARQTKENNEEILNHSIKLLIDQHTVNISKAAKSLKQSPRKALPVSNVVQIIKDTTLEDQHHTEVQKDGTKNKVKSKKRKRVGNDENEESFKKVPKTSNDAATIEEQQDPPSEEETTPEVIRPGRLTHADRMKKKKQSKRRREERIASIKKQKDDQFDLIDHYLLEIKQSFQESYRSEGPIKEESSVPPLSFRVDKKGITTPPLSNFQKRSKWKNKVRNLKENDIVLIKQNSHRNSWPLGRVLKCKFSKDGLVRSVVLALRPLHEGVSRTLERSIHDLVLLISS